MSKNDEPQLRIDKIFYDLFVQISKVQGIWQNLVVIWQKISPGI